MNFIRMFITALILLSVVALSAFALFLVLQFWLEKKKVYKNLNNKHVVITGGSSGIGKAAAIEAAKLGAHVTIIGRDLTRLQLAVQEISSKCSSSDQKVSLRSLDVTSDYESIKQCLSSLEVDVGPIFMLVNCAGMCICGEFENLKADDIKHMIDLNYFGTAYPTKYVLPGMKERNEGLIVFVSSEAALIGIYGYSAYSAAKWAVRGLAESVMMELVGTKVRLMLAMPPDTDTPGFKNEELTKPKETKLISGSAGLFSPEDVAKTMIQDAMIGKTYSVYSFSGKLMSLLYGGSIDNAYQVILQVFSMGFLRLIIVGVMMSFHKIVRDERKLKQAVVKNK